MYCWEANISWIVPDEVVAITVLGLTKIVLSNQEMHGKLVSAIRSMGEKYVIEHTDTVSTQGLISTILIVRPR